MAEPTAGRPPIIGCRLDQHRSGRTHSISTSSNNASTPLCFIRSRGTTVVAAINLHHFHQQNVLQRRRQHPPPNPRAGQGHRHRPRRLRWLLRPDCPPSGIQLPVHGKCQAATIGAHPNKSSRQVPEPQLPAWDTPTWVSRLSTTWPRTAR